MNNININSFLKTVKIESFYKTLKVEKLCKKYLANWEKITLYEKLFFQTSKVSKCECV